MASYHFLSGFTAKVAGTEAGVLEPEPTFSACFGAPFMPRDPVVYADMLADRLRTSPTQCWLVNTGWSGGPYGVGTRMPIAVTRALAQGRAGGRARYCRDRSSIRCSACSSRRAAPACPRNCSTRGRRGAAQKTTTRRRQSWRGSSARTSSASPAACRPTSPRPARGCSLPRPTSRARPLPCARRRPRVIGADDRCPPGRRARFRSRVRQYGPASCAAARFTTPGDARSRAVCARTH